MMKHLFTVLSWACFTSLSFSQYLTLTDSNAVWSVQQWKYFSTGDSLINSNSYIKIIEGTQPGFSVPGGPVSFLIRSEPNGKTYSRNDTIDYLIYDFSLNTGDTGTAYMPSGGAYGNFIVDSTDVIFMAGANRKFIYVHNPLLNWGETWIEGIGTMNGFSLSNYPLTGMIIDFYCFTDPFLLCYHENGVQLFQNTNTPFGMWMQMVDSCYWICTQGIDQTESVIFQLYPNPSTSYVNIAGLEHDSHLISIFNVLGERLVFGKLTTSNSQVDISGLNDGVYFLEITDQKTNKKTILKFAKVD